jgi:hypothetical protein
LRAKIGVVRGDFKIYLAIVFGEGAVHGSVGLDQFVAVITRLVRVIHLSAHAAAWIARTNRAMTM